MYQKSGHNESASLASPPAPDSWRGSICKGSAHVRKPAPSRPRSYPTISPLELFGQSGFRSRKEGRVDFADRKVLGPAEPRWRGVLGPEPGGDDRLLAPRGDQARARRDGGVRRLLRAVQRAQRSSVAGGGREFCEPAQRLRDPLRSQQLYCLAIKRKQLQSEYLVNS